MSMVELIASLTTNSTLVCETIDEINGPQTVMPDDEEWNDIKDVLEELKPKVDALLEQACENLGGE